MYFGRYFVLLWEVFASIWKYFGMHLEVLWEGFGRSFFGGKN